MLEAWLQRTELPSSYARKAKLGGMKVSDAQRLKALEAEKGKLKRLLANSRSTRCARFSREDSPAA